ncbi:MAG: alpha/beta hydrolase [Gemmatimonadota bacterium]|nr:alpha/beta hydrolase [Gemmatimonadota bacterium]
MITRVNSIELSYDDIGTGLPLVLLHAFPLDRSMWAPQAGALLRQGRCVAPDLRGFGASTPAPPYSMDQYADDVAALLDTLGAGPAVVVGLSMGGYIAFAFWRRHRAKVRALVLADTRAGADTDEGREKRRRLIEVARSRGSGTIAEMQLASMVGETTRQRRPDVVETVRAMMAAAPVDGIVGALEAMMARPDSTPTLATIDVPTLIVVGDEDTLTPPKEAEAMQERIRGSRLEVIAQAGHICNLERPAAFTHVVSEFVEGVAIG